MVSQHETTVLKIPVNGHDVSAGHGCMLLDLALQILPFYTSLHTFQRFSACY